MIRRARFLLVEDHPIFRKGLAQLIMTKEGYEVVAEAGNRAEALEAFERCSPDLVVMDISLGPESGLELLKDLRARRPDILILVLSMHEEELYAERVLRAGARAYVQKDEAAQRVLEAVACVLSGKVWLSPTVKDRIVQSMFEGRSSVERDLLSSLSDREFEIFGLMGRGLGTRQIAERLGLSVKTVDSHKEHLKRKLQCSGAADLRMRAIEWRGRERGDE
jgi:DNA-binding NarL/FixJ family response regulator